MAAGDVLFVDDGDELAPAFDVEVSDGTLSDGPVAATINFGNVNDDPVADNESFTVLEGGTANEADLDAGANLLDGDTDADLPGDTLTVNTTPVSGPTYGSLTLFADGRFTYTHDGSENFTDSFTYEVSDGAGGIDQATVTITITPQSDNDPVADDESFTVLEGGTANEADLDAGANLLDGDTDADLPGDTLTVNTTPVSGPTYGSLTLFADGRFTYTHDGSENFTDSFTYEVSDGAGGIDQATVTITITPQSDNDPVADDESFTVLEGGTATEADLDAGANLLDGDTDADLPGDTLTVNTTPVSGPTYGSLTLFADGRFTYTHDGSENFTDSFTYEVSDGAGGTDTATVTITITPVNDSEQMVSTNNGTTVDEGSTGNAITAAMLETTDIDNMPDELIYTLGTAPTNGTLYLNSTALVATNTFTQDDIDNGRISYDHDDTENLNDSFMLQVDDGAGIASTGTFAIGVNPINDNDPVADDESFTVLEGGTANEADLDAGVNLLDGDTDTDLPNDTLTVNTTPVSGPTYGSLTLLADGRFTYTHDGTENFTDSFTYEVSDGAGGTDTATVTITITPVNDSEQMVSTNTGTTVDEGSTGNAITAAMLETTDIDNTPDELIYTLGTAPNNGTLYLNTTALADNDTFTQDDIDNGRISYDHDDTENLNDSFVFSVDDGVGVASSGTFAITVNPINDNDPVADDESFSVARRRHRDPGQSGRGQQPARWRHRCRSAER